MQEQHEAEQTGQQLVGINLSNKQFVQDCHNEMAIEPGILPAFIDPNSVRNDFQLWLQLDQVKLATHDLLDKLSDTQFLAGVCQIYYCLVEAAAKAGLPGPMSATTDSRSGSRNRASGPKLRQAHGQRGRHLCPRNHNVGVGGAGQQRSVFCRPLSVLHPPVWIRLPQRSPCY